MSYYLQIDTTVGPIQIASNVGYGEFGDWVDSLDAKTYGELIHLYEHGWSQDIADLIGQLDSAIKDEPPKKADVLDVATTLAEYLKGEEKAIVATITDGLGDGEDDSATKSVKEVARAPAGSPIGGQFIAGGGASGAASSAGHVTGSDGGRLMHLAELPVKLEHAVTHAVTHAAKSAVSFVSGIWSGGGSLPAEMGKAGAVIAHIGGGVNLLANAGTKAYFSSWIAGNKAVELVSRAKGFLVKGLSESEVARVKGICAGYDVLACKAVFLGLEHASLKHLAGASMFIPTASLAYLAYSTATNPVAVIKAAKNAVKSVADKFRKKPKAFDPTDTKDAVAKLCDAAKKHAGEDYFFACLTEAIEETGEHGGDISDAIELAGEAAKAKPHEQ